MPSTNRNAFKEYKKEHIKNSIFFDSQSVETKDIKIFFQDIFDDILQLYNSF